MAWSQSHYDTAIAMGLPANTASFIASRNNPGRALRNNYSRHVEAYGTPGPEPTRAQAPPKARDPIQAPEAVSLRPETQTGVRRSRSRRDMLGLTNRGMSSAFSYSPGAGLGGFGGSGLGY